MDNNFWLSQPNQLIDKKYVFNVIPKDSMNKNEKLNALVRLSFFISVVFSLITNDSNYFVIFFLTLLVTVLIWNQTKEKYQEEEEKKQAEEKEFDIENSKFLEGIDDPTTTGAVTTSGITTTKSPSTSTTFVPDNTEKTEGCSEPLKNNPMINLLPSNYYNQKFACPYTEDFEKKQKEFLKGKISPENNEIYPDNLYFRQFYPVPLPGDKRNFFTSLPITEDRKRCKVSNENDLAIRFACSF